MSRRFLSFPLYLKLPPKLLLKVLGVCTALFSFLGSTFGIVRQFLNGSNILNTPRLLLSVTICIFALICLCLWLSHILSYHIFANRADRAVTSNLTGQRQNLTDQHDGITSEHLLDDHERSVSSPPGAPTSSYSTNVFSEDPMYQFGKPEGPVRCYVVPKKGEPLLRCQDSYALNISTDRYVVTDGVTHSFAQRPWATIVAREFVGQNVDLNNTENFVQWLNRCQIQWHQWVMTKWIPTINKQHEIEGKIPEDYTQLIDQQGAQTTFIGCVLRGMKTTDKAPREVQVFSIGDAESFLFRFVHKEWILQNAFPFTSSHEFTDEPATLPTRSELKLDALKAKQSTYIPTQPGDLLVLTSDALAKWILSQIEQENKDWMWLLTNTDQDAFAQFIDEARASMNLENDDTTLLIIPI